MSVLTLSRERIYEGSLILVNREHPFHEGAAEPLVAIGEQTSVLLRQQAAARLEELMAGLGGWRDIVPVSGWRSLEEQQKLWDDTVAESGLAFTRKYVALPGHSEHQTGLAIDLGLRRERIDLICPEFPYTGICQRFRERAADYGFVERYPASKEAVTGIGHEPWHFRYVGRPHGKIMTEKRLTLEEYITFLRQFPHGSSPYTVRSEEGVVSVSYHPADGGGDTLLEVDTQRPYSVSGNNFDGFIITQWR